MASRSAYETLFAAAAVEFFTSLSGRRQRKRFDSAHGLPVDPSLVQNFGTADSSGREISHLMIDGFIFEYWVDHAVKQVIITEIDNVE